MRIHTTPSEVSSSLTSVGFCARSIRRWRTRAKELTCRICTMIRFWRSKRSTIWLLCLLFVSRCRLLYLCIFGGRPSQMLGASTCLGIPWRWTQLGWSTQLLICGVENHTTSTKTAATPLDNNWQYTSCYRFINPAENLSVAVLAMGEGWHNYHHTFPWDYKTSELGKYSTNFTAAFIDTMAKIGWAYDLKTVPNDMIKKRVQRTGDGTHELWGWGDKDQTEEERNGAIVINKKDQWSFDVTVIYQVCCPKNAIVYIR